MVWGTNFAPFAMSIILNAFKYYIMAMIKEVIVLCYVDDTSIYGSKDKVAKALALLKEKFKLCNLTVNEKKSSTEP